MIKIMFVCHGNICRSTMAEFVMKDIVKKSGCENDFLIRSSATSTEEIGNDTHWGTKKILDEMNVPYTKRQAVQLTKSDYDKYDFIIGMDSANMRNINRIIGYDKDNKTHKLLSFDTLTVMLQTLGTQEISRQLMTMFCLVAQNYLNT